MGCREDQDFGPDNIDAWCFVFRDGGGGAGKVERTGGPPRAGEARCKRIQDEGREGESVGRKGGTMDERVYQSDGRIEKRGGRRDEAGEVDCRAYG